MAQIEHKKMTQIVASLRERILSGEWQVGQRLPTDLEFANEMKCSIGTVIKAMGLLAYDGLLERKSKTGTKLLRTSLAQRSNGVNLDAFALIYPSDHHEGFIGIHSGFVSAALNQKRPLITIPLEFNVEKEIEVLARLDEFDVRGVAISPLISCAQDQLTVSQLLKKVRVPVVVIGLHLPGFHSASVQLDSFHAGYETTRYLIKKGCNRVGFLSNNSWRQFMRDRFSGYRWAMEEAGIKVSPEWIHRSEAMSVDLKNPTHESTFLAKEYLKSSPSVDGVVCGDDFLAVGLVNAAVEAGIEIPNKLLICGIDDFSIARACVPHLTTYHVPYDTIGKRSFDLLQSLMGKNESNDREVLIRGEIVARESA
jgi:DNA-binding LacI/PurR family transcriptional regulator